MTDEKIDFVITWGSNTDLEWRKQYEYYAAQYGRSVDKSVYRYRSWDTLHFLFRGIEKYAPWVKEFLLCLDFHLFCGRNQLHFVDFIFNGVAGRYFCVANDKIGQMRGVRVMECHAVDFDAGNVPYADVFADRSLGVEKDDFRDFVGYIHSEVLDGNVGPAFFHEFRP